MSIFNHFNNFNLTADQKNALVRLETFLESPTQVFMLKGYAGSGKTTIIKGLLDYLRSINKNFDLMAPTGRAAKVIKDKTAYTAYTIHKSIYSYKQTVETENNDSTDYHYTYIIQNNNSSVNKIYIVDEASMISDAENHSNFFRFGTGKLLSDLITYTNIQTQNINAKIIFVGDPCQLPPVSDNSSKAFDADYLKKIFNLDSEEVEMKEVKRQTGAILTTAAKIRKSMTAGYFNDFNLRSNGQDILHLSYKNFIDTWQKVEKSKIIIAYKNQTCVDLNLKIRERLFGKADLPVQKGDIVIMGGNNYKNNVFNGEFAVVNEVGDITTRREIHLKGKNNAVKVVPLTWRDVELVFLDSDSNNKIVKGKILENFLYGDNQLKPEELQALYVDFLMQHESLKPKMSEFKPTLMNDEYFNCLLIKYGYAVTCHKAQGGEWDSVFTIWDHDPSETFNCFNDKQQRAGKTNKGFYRWSYTAITRASKKLYALNPPFFNSYSAMTLIDQTTINSLLQLNNNPLQAEVIIVDEDLQLQLSSFNLLNYPLSIQDHFIKVSYVCKKHNIEIVEWKKIAYEIRYRFKKESDTAMFKTFINGNNEFKNTLTPIPNLSTNTQFNETIAQILNNYLPLVDVQRPNQESNTLPIEFDEKTEEQFPFTRNLFDDLTPLLQENKISINTIEHLQYKERYGFKRNNEKATLDFEYNGNGFFGRVVPIKNTTNSPSLIAAINKVLQTLKQQDYAH
ncbi:MAG: AAA family ATPase [Phycisphaerales bacterium]|nr:AAA family ATPase [Phycisphaerales bacterium]